MPQSVDQNHQKGVTFFSLFYKWYVIQAFSEQPQPQPPPYSLWSAEV